MTGSCEGVDTVPGFCRCYAIFLRTTVGACSAESVGIRSAPLPARSSHEQTVDAFDRRDHIQGPRDATVELVEYGDYECPHCKAAYPIVKWLQAEFDTNLRFAYRHFPLIEIHPLAEPAAEAAEAAGAQGNSGKCTTCCSSIHHGWKLSTCSQWRQRSTLTSSVFGDELAASAFAARPG